MPKGTETVVNVEEVERLERCIDLAFIPLPRPRMRTDFKTSVQTAGMRRSRRVAFSMSRTLIRFLQTSRGKITRIASRPRALPAVMGISCLQTVRILLYFNEIYIAAPQRLPSQNNLRASSDSHRLSPLLRLSRLQKKAIAGLETDFYIDTPDPQWETFVSRKTLVKVPAAHRLLWRRLFGLLVSRLR